MEADGESEHRIIAEHTPGLDLFLDVGAVDSASANRIARVLEGALAAVKQAGSAEPSGTAAIGGE